MRMKYIALGLALASPLAFTACSTSAIESPVYVTKTNYLTCPQVTLCSQSQPTIHNNGDLVGAYLLVKNERDLCSAQVAMTYDCQTEAQALKPLIPDKEN